MCTYKQEIIWIVGLKTIGPPLPWLPSTRLKGVVVRTVGSAVDPEGILILNFCVELTDIFRITAYAWLSLSPVGLPNQEAVVLLHAARKHLAHDSSRGCGFVYIVHNWGHVSSMCTNGNRTCILDIMTWSIYNSTSLSLLHAGQVTQVREVQVRARSFLTTEKP